MKLGIRPIVDFAFAKLFASPENKIVLIAFLNAILQLDNPIVDLKVENPFNLRDFEEDKLSILDIKAKDSRGRIFNIEMQLAIQPSFVKRIVYYGAELYSNQLTQGIDYDALRPVYCISLIERTLFSDTTQVHHRFQLLDRSSGRVLQDTIEFHTLELGVYNLTELELATASAADRWLYWLLHAQEYDSGRLEELFPEVEFLRATQTLVEIYEKTEDKSMYDARQKAIRDREWAMKHATNQGLEEGRQQGHQEGRQEGIKIGEERGKIRMLEQLLNLPATEAAQLEGLSIEDLKNRVESLQGQLRTRS